MNQHAKHLDGKISVLIVNYKTRRLTGLCLSLIKEKFDLTQLQVIVVDNDSDRTLGENSREGTHRSFRSAGSGHAGRQLQIRATYAYRYAD